MVARAHQAVGAYSCARHGVPVALAVVVHVGEATQQMPILVAERANAQIGRRAAKAGQQVEVSVDVPMLQVDVEVVRPQVPTVLGLAGIEHV